MLGHAAVFDFANGVGCRSAMERCRIAAVPLAMLMLLIIAGCSDNRRSATKKETEPVSLPAKPVEATVPTPSARLTPAPVVLDILNPDLLESRDCITVLSFYADALNFRMYGEAARVWGKDWGVTAASLEMRYSADQPLSLEIGKASVEGGAGSLYCEVAAVLMANGRQSRSGKITLRRVNDVPGATADQLRWHIIESTFAERDAPL